MTLQVYAVCTNKDRELFDELDGYLSALKRQGLIALHHCTDDSNENATAQIREAELVLVFLTPDLIKSTLWQGALLQQVRAQRDQKRTVVVPLLMKECSWSDSWMAPIRGLPTSGRPLTAVRNQDEEWVQIVKTVQRIATTWQAPGSGRSDDAKSAAPAPAASAPAAERIDPAAVRGAYRGLHDYHAQLLRFVDQTRRAVVRTLGPLPEQTWSPYLMEHPPSFAGVSRKSSFEHIGMAQCSFTWTSTNFLLNGGCRVVVVHNGDDGFQSGRAAATGLLAASPTVKESHSTLSVYVTQVKLTAGDKSPASWAEVDQWLAPTPALPASHWVDGQAHSLTVQRSLVRYGGLVRNVADIDFHSPEKAWLEPLGQLVTKLLDE